MLIPPTNNTYLDKLKSGQQGGGQNQQEVGGGQQSSQMQSSNQSSLFSKQQQLGGNSSLSQQQGMQDQGGRPLRYTAAMMAQSNSAQARGSVGGSNQGSPMLSSTTDQMNQQFLQQNNVSRITVVEPSSTSNSPAPHLLGGGGVGGASGSFAMHNKNQQQQQQRQQQGSAQQPGTVINIGGRASAPPQQTQVVSGIPHGGMTTMVMNNAAIRAYTASSLQMRVAELHQELGGQSGQSGQQPQQGGQQQQQQQQLQQRAGNVIVTTSPPPPPGTVTLSTIPPGAIPVVLTPAPTPPPHMLQQQGRPPSRGGQSPVTNIMPVQQQGVVVQMPNIKEVDPEQQKKEREAVAELSPFLRDAPTKNNGKNSPTTSSKPSNNKSNSTRGLAILYASSLNVPDVRSMCEAFGALESFRSDFGESCGVYFATFYDLRSAQLAVGELPKVLNKGSKSSGSGSSSNTSGRVQVKYCVPLNSSSSMDESLLMISKLPSTVDEQDLSHILSSFGEVRAIHYQANASDEDDDGNELTSYLVEFYDIQDARQALLELEQVNPWGGNATVKVGTRSPAKRKQGKDMIMLMSRWRHGVVAQSKDGGGSEEQSQQGNTENTVSPTPSPSPLENVGREQQHLQQTETDSSQTARTGHIQNQHDQIQQHQMQAHSQQLSYYQYQNPGQQPLQQYQLVVGPDGQYQYVPQMHHYGHPGQIVIDPHTGQQHVMQYPMDQTYMHHNPHMNPQQQYHAQYNGGAPGMVQVDASSQQPPTPFIRMPSDVNSSSLSSGSHLSPGGSRVRSSPARSSTNGKSNNSIGSGSSGNNSRGNNSGGNNSGEDDLSLSIENVRLGKERRTSLMVRNIPNKYTQQMLLSEFAAAGHGTDKMDFFYLPIDFKNKCNRGYAFVNFVDYRDIIPFFDEYNKRGWKRFNSDKICDITYARIQGKAAMLKRFQNSQLMEKDDEYRPQVFVSHGSRKGQREELGNGG